MKMNMLKKFFQKNYIKTKNKIINSIKKSKNKKNPKSKAIKRKSMYRSKMFKNLKRLRKATKNRKDWKGKILKN